MPHPTDPTAAPKPAPSSGETLDESGAMMDEDDGIPGAEPPPDDLPSARRPKPASADTGNAAASS